MSGIPSFAEALKASLGDDPDSPTVGDLCIRAGDEIVAVLEAVNRAAERVRRDPRHRVSMLVNDWTPLVDALNALNAKAQS